MSNLNDRAWILLDPIEYLPCSIGVVARRDRVDEIRLLEESSAGQEYFVRAILSDHVPLAGTMDSILSRPVYHGIAVNEKSLTIYLHHGGRNAVFYDLVSSVSSGLIDFIELEVKSSLPSRCFNAARRAVSELLDSMMRTMWLPIVVQRLDLYLRGRKSPLCHQLMLPFQEGIKWGPLGGFTQFSILAPYEALIREAITATSPFYRLLCAYRLYEGIQPLRKSLRELGESLGVSDALPKSPAVEPQRLTQFGFHHEFVSGIKNADDFWKKTTDLRNRAAHFLLKGEERPISFSDGNAFAEFGIVAAVLLHYSHLAYTQLAAYLSTRLGGKLHIGSVLPEVESRSRYVLRADPKDEK